eukprot:8969657-Karenia_brevis.AAC.1
MEVCGGQALTTRIAVRRKLKGGQNFDVVCGLDLMRPVHVEYLWQYLRTCCPRVIVMAPPCTALSGWSRFNRHRNPLKYWRQRRIGVSLAHLCAQLAWWQITHGRDFLVENPSGSDCFKLKSWVNILNMRDVVCVNFHQCQTGLKDDAGWPILKPTCIVASHELLIKRLKSLVCPRNHTHAKLEGSINGHPRCHRARIWTKHLCDLIVSGIIDTINYRIQHNNAAYTTINHTTYPALSEESPEDWIKCKACKNNLPKDDHRHTRDPDSCKRALDQPSSWTCPGCCRNPPRPRGHKDHTLEVGSCKWATASYRHPHTRSRGAHPREARVPAAAEPTADLRVDEG